MWAPWSWLFIGLKAVRSAMTVTSNYFRDTEAILQRDILE
jgi:hypothetical protein